MTMQTRTPARHAGSGENRRIISFLMATAESAAPSAGTQPHDTAPNANPASPQPPVNPAAPQADTQPPAVPAPASQNAPSSDPNNPGTKPPQDSNGKLPVANADKPPQDPNGKRVTNAPSNSTSCRCLQYNRVTVSWSYQRASNCLAVAVV